jgi:flotillin
VAATRARANIQRKQNELRQIRAELEAQAKSEEERAIAGANEARATAEKLLQEIRGQLEELRLIADVTIPADIDRQVREHLAAGDAATIAADGEAMATALAAIAAAWRDSQGRAMDMFVLQHLDEIFGQVAKAARNLKVGEVNLVDGGDGKTLPSYASAYPATVGALLSQVSQTLGVDVSQVITGRSSADPGNGAPARVKPALPGSSAAMASAARPAGS